LPAVAAPIIAIKNVDNPAGNSSSAPFQTDKIPHTVIGRIAQKNVQSSLISFQASTKSYEAASAYLRLIEKGYKEGVSTYLETVDARNQWMNATINYQLKQFNVLIAAAAYEREAASYPL
jgi:hypothetical protein